MGGNFETASKGFPFLQVAAEVLGSEIGGIGSGNHLVLVWMKMVCL